MNRKELLLQLQALPILFPLLAAFHILMLLITIFNFARENVLDTFIATGSILQWLLYTILWVNISLQRRWAAIAYIVLTAVNLIIQFLILQHTNWQYISNTLFPFDVLLCFYALFYYKRFR